MKLKQEEQTKNTDLKVKTHKGYHTIKVKIRNVKCPICDNTVTKRQTLLVKKFVPKVGTVEARVCRHHNDVQTITKKLRRANLLKTEEHMQPKDRVLTYRKRIYKI